MWGVWILMLACISLGASQEYVDYEYVEVAAPETNARSRQSSAPVPQLNQKPRRPGKKTKPRGTTPVPILTDIRRVDPHTGAFYYHYAGGDGSMKHEVRFANGTVLGNYTYVKEDGTLETNTYHHGLGTNIIDNDNGNYDLHRHLEEAYVHQSGPDPVEELFPEDAYLQPNTVRTQSQSRPFAQPRPVPRNPGNRVRVQAQRRPITQEQAPSAFSYPQPVPLDFHDSQTAFSIQDESRQNLNRNDVDYRQAQASELKPIVEYVYDDHQAQASALEPVYVYEDYEFVPAQRQEGELVPVAVSGQ